MYLIMSYQQQGYPTYSHPKYVKFGRRKEHNRLHAYLKYDANSYAQRDATGFLTNHYMNTVVWCV